MRAITSSYMKAIIIATFLLNSSLAFAAGGALVGDLIGKVVERGGQNVDVLLGSIVKNGGAEAAIFKKFFSDVLSNDELNKKAFFDALAEDTFFRSIRDKKPEDLSYAEVQRLMNKVDFYNSLMSNNLSCSSCTAAGAKFNYKEMYLPLPDEFAELGLRVPKTKAEVKKTLRQIRGLRSQNGQSFPIVGIDGKTKNVTIKLAADVSDTNLKEMFLAIKGMQTGIKKTGAIAALKKLDGQRILNLKFIAEFQNIDGVVHFNPDLLRLHSLAFQGTIADQAQIESLLRELVVMKGRYVNEVGQINDVNDLVKAYVWGVKTMAEESNDKTKKAAADELLKMKDTQFFDAEGRPLNFSCSCHRCEKV